MPASAVPAEFWRGDRRPARWGGQVGESIIPTSESKGLLVFWDASCWHSERRGRGGNGDIVGGEGVGGGEETNGVVSSRPPRPALPLAAQISYLWS